jgi:hypothetical protein
VARAEALAHLETCERCRVAYAELTETVDRIVLLTPTDEPPAGFEQRVLARIEAEMQPVPIRRRPRRLLVVGAAAAVLVLVAVAAGARWTADGHVDSDVIEVSMRTASGREVGDAYLHQEDPAWVFVTVPDWKPAAGVPYAVRVELADHSVVDVPGGTLDAGSGAWGTVLHVRGDDVRKVALVGPDGTVWCSATVPA